MGKGILYEMRKLSEISPDPNQPRRNIDKDKIEEMAKSIKTEGIINAIEIDENNVIVTGETRWRAAQVAGLEMIPCKVISIEGRDRFRRQVIENVCNNTMNPIDTAKALEKLLEKYSTSSPGELVRDPHHSGEYHSQGIKELAEEIGKGKSFISEHLDLLKMTKPIQEMIKAGTPRSISRSVNKIPDEHKVKFQEKIANNEFKSRDIAVGVASLIAKNPDNVDKILEIDFSNKSMKEAQDAITDEIGESFDISQTLDNGEKMIDVMELLLIRLNEMLGKNKKGDIPSFFSDYLTNAITLTISNLQNWLSEKETTTLKPFSQKSSQITIDGEVAE